MIVAASAASWCLRPESMKAGWGPRPGPVLTSRPLARPKVPKLEPPPPSVEDQSRLDCEAEMRDYAEDGDWNRALGLIDDMAAKGIEQGPAIWTGALKACAKAGRWQEATGLLEAMGKARAGPDHGAFLLAIEACDGQGVPEHSLQLMQQMNLRGLQPNINMYMKALTQLVQSGKRLRAQEIYREANERGLISVWHQRGRFLDIRDMPIEVAQLIVRFAVEERAQMMVGTTAGRGGFYIITGPANKKTAFLQQAIVQVLRDEYGLKVQVDPARFGRVRIRGGELKQLALEREFSDTYSGAAD